ncbi:MAG: flagellar biosynthetic protein FliQ [Thermotogae bacterium]|nr:flagellar biosynthesis protein FliQ [Thermotogota bacterium]RKX43424.1 MAG: flagellar biosynthetic protein FliQ [Thermotogota bacterium]RLG30541.1 MAG: flagellar biosynthetic protein FliQ [Methanosarcinales archaeon]
MTSEVFLEVMNTGLLTLLKVVAPVLLISLIVGLVISFFQAVTQIHEQTLTFAPKILIVFLTLVFLGGWILQQIVEYAYEILTRYMALI